MIQKVAALILLALVTEQVSSVSILHIKVDDDHLIKVGNYSYGLIGSALKERNISTVDVNGKTVVKFNVNCKETITDLTKLSAEERKVMDNIGHRLNHVATPLAPLEAGQKYAKTLYVGNKSHIDSTTGVKSSTQQVDRFVVVQHDQDYSVEIAEDSHAPLPFNWIMYFVIGDVVATVSKASPVEDNHISLMPTKCLHPDQARFIRGVEEKLHKAKVVQPSV